MVGLDENTICFQPIDIVPKEFPVILFYTPLHILARIPVCAPYSGFVPVKVHRVSIKLFDRYPILTTQPTLPSRKKGYPARYVVIHGIFRCRTLLQCNLATKLLLKINMFAKATGPRSLTSQ